MVKVPTSSGNWIKAIPENKGKVIEFLDEGVFEESTKYTYEDGKPKINFNFRVKINGEEYGYRMNASSRTAMVEAFGDESKEWVGKKARIIVMPTPNGDHKMIILDPIIDGQKNDW